MKRKAASPKTLLASLLAVGIIIYKIINFEDIFDLLWIALFGYLLAKGLRVAFSQEAYDEDVRRAYQGRALYLDLFGKFAFIAGDVPVISLVLALPLAGLCPGSAVRYAVGAAAVCGRVCGLVRVVHGKAQAAARGERPVGLGCAEPRGGAGLETV